MYFPRVARAKNRVPKDFENGWSELRFDVKLQRQENAVVRIAGLIRLATRPIPAASHPGIKIFGSAHMKFEIVSGSGRKRGLEDGCVHLWEANFNILVHQEEQATRTNIY